MKTLSYQLADEQYRALTGLAHFVAIRYQMIAEESGKIENPERKEIERTITESCFPDCDRLGIPFWVQNIVLVWAEDFLNVRREYLWQHLKTKNVLWK